MSDDERARSGRPRPLFNLAEVAAITRGRIVDGRAEELAGVVVTGVEVDSRFVRAGDLFGALAGERVDGHSFVARALDAGAVAALVTRDPGPKAHRTGRRLLTVPDVVKALGQLAKHHRDRFSLPIVAVTGSVGKTTTKDLIASVLGSSRRVLANRGNLNTDIGLPLTLFELGPEHQVACLEMGMRGAGEIARLAELARPVVGVITNVGPVHIELLGSVPAIARAKEELLWALPREGTAILNGDDPILAGLAKGHRSRLARVIIYGLDQPADLSAEELESLPDGGMSFGVVHEGLALGRFSVPLAGRHSALNALAALAVGLSLGLDPEAMRAGLARPRLSAMRQEIIDRGGVRVINDAYNAGPASMTASLELLTGTRAGRGGRAVAVLGDMLELGELTEAAHRDLGRATAAAGLDYVIAVGPRSATLAEEARRGLGEGKVTHFDPGVADPNREAAALALRLLQPGDTVLVKASRGMKFEEIVGRLLAGLERGGPKQREAGPKRRKGGGNQ